MVTGTTSRTARFGAVLMAAWLVGAALPAAAQMSGANSTTTGSSCSGSNNSDGFCGSASGLTTNTGTQVVSRYQWNINADVGVASTRDTSGTAVHNVTFNASAPGGYRLDISSRFTGDMNRQSDVSGCDGQANVSGVTATTNSGFYNNTAPDIADPGSVGNGGGNSTTPFNTTATAQIYRVSNGGSFGHSLSFTWNGNVRSNSCEAAVRIGLQNGTTSDCGACGYSGSPSRDINGDGHFVTVNFTSLCGNGTVDSAPNANGLTEQCDQGAANGTAGSCCSSSCQFKTNGTACTDDGNTCTNDVCNGSSVTCTHPNNTASCSDGVFCNGADTCSGGTCAVHAGNPCPGADGDGNCSESCNEATDSCTAADPNGSTCNDGAFCNGNDTCSGGACSVHTGNPCPGADGDGNCSESCNEASDNCTAPDPNGSACTDGLFCNGSDTCSGGTCSGHTGDPCAGGPECNDTCNEAVDNCLDPAGTVCSNDGLICTTDVCNGGGSCTHPAGNAGAVCRPGSGDSCDPAESCDGASTSCPTDVVTAGGTLCRAGSGDSCDPDESCTGTPGATCPSNVITPGGTVCNPGSGDVCDPDETCSGVAGQTCPSDNVASSGTVCRPGSGDVCDPDETCSGNPDEACPSDTVTAGGTVCRTGSGDLCDPDEACTGNAGEPCPTDSVAGAFVQCRASSGDCDAAENCTGNAGEGCPADVVAGPFVECRAAAGPCDVAENCDGSGTICPPDAVQPATQECRASAGACDLAETCDGVNVACPADAKSTALCRGSAGICDVAESCDGVNNACPADAFAPATQECRGVANACDVAEHCTGTSATCPADTGQPDGDGDGVCDVVDLCDTVADPGNLDGDNDGKGDACDPCNNIAPTAAVKPKLTILKLLTAPGDDKLKFKGSFTNVPNTPPVDPVANGIRILLTDSANNTTVDITIPGGAYTTGTGAGWKASGSGASFLYKNSGKVVPLINGINKVKLSRKPTAPTTIKFTVGGKGGNYVVNTANLPITGTLVFLPPNAVNGQCGEATATCALAGGGATVKCK